jgi:hypothetical protein
MARANHPSTTKLALLDSSKISEITTTCILAVLAQEHGPCEHPLTTQLATRYSIYQLVNEVHLMFLLPHLLLRNMARANHPDKNPRPEARATFLAGQAAYERLVSGSSGDQGPQVHLLPLLSLTLSMFLV